MDVIQLFVGGRVVLFRCIQDDLASLIIELERNMDQIAQGLFDL